jgi:hypothetical protein
VDVVVDPEIAGERRLRAARSRWWATTSETGPMARRMWSWKIGGAMQTASFGRNGTFENRAPGAARRSG